VIARLVAAAAVFLCATIALGAAVAHRPPGALDVAATALRGHAVSLALFFTSLGRWWMLLPIAVVALGVGMSARANLIPLTIVFAAQAASQAATTLLKLAFHRIRPGVYVGPLESDLSFPSGHAVTAIVFFGGLAILAWQAPFPRPVAAAAAIVLVICAIGIPWSRLALGAHYATDVIGGLFFGAAWLCAALALMLRLSATASR
jgi:membrane-associated phospholipid phosphatase